MRKLLLTIFLLALFSKASASSSLWFGSTGGYTLPTTAGTSYLLPVGGRSSTSTTQSSRQHKVSTAGALSNFKVSLSVSPGAGKSYTFTVQKNGSDTLITCTIAGTDTSGQDWIHSINVVAGDLIGIKVVTVGAPSTSTGNKWGFQFDSTNPAESMLFGTTAQGNLATSGIDYIALGDSNQYSITESRNQIVIPTSGKLKNLHIELGTAPGANQSRIFTIRKNSVNTSLTFTISGANTTGNDTTDTVSVVAGDIITLSDNTNSTTPAASTCKAGITFLADIDGEFIIPYSPGTTNMSSSETRYTSIWGGNIVWYASSSSAIISQITTNSCIMKNIYVVTGTQPGGSYTIGLNQNSVNVGLSTVISGLNVIGTNANNINVSPGDILATFEIPSGTPNATYATISYTGYIAPVRTILRNCVIRNAVIR